MFFRQRKVDVAVAVVYEPEKGFFLTYNRRWHAYAFPMRKCRTTDSGPEHSALEALREATKLPFAHAEGKPFLYRETEGISEGAGKETLYRYHAYEFELPRNWLAEAPTLGFACQSGFVPLSRLTPPPEGAMAEPTGQADLVTWSTRFLASELVCSQQVAVSVIRRIGPAGPEILMVRNANYGGYFPAAARLRRDVSPQVHVQQAVRADTGYPGFSETGQPRLIEVEQFSPRYQCRRQFSFHLVPVHFLAAPDLSVPGNPFQRYLQRTRASWRWVGMHALSDPPAHGLSPTVSLIADALREMAELPL